MKRYSSVVGSRFERFGIADPHYLNRCSRYRGGYRL